MHRIVHVKALPDYHLRLKFSDGTEGVVDLSDMVGKGIFTAWKDKKLFALAQVDTQTHTVAWPGGIDLCPDSLYAEVKGKDAVTFLKKESSAEVKG